MLPISIIRLPYMKRCAQGGARASLPAITEWWSRSPYLRISLRQ